MINNNYELTYKIISSILLIQEKANRESYDGIYENEILLIDKGEFNKDINQLKKEVRELIKLIKFRDKDLNNTLLNIINVCEE
jgi:hypothetical protein